MNGTTQFRQLLAFTAVLAGFSLRVWSQPPAKQTPLASGQIERVGTGSGADGASAGVKPSLSDFVTCTQIAESEKDTNFDSRTDQINVSLRCTVDGSINAKRSVQGFDLERIGPLKPSELGLGSGADVTCDVIWRAVEMQFPGVIYAGYCWNNSVTENAALTVTQESSPELPVDLGTWQGDGDLASIDVTVNSAPNLAKGVIAFRLRGTPRSVPIGACCGSGSTCEVLTEDECHGAFLRAGSSCGALVGCCLSDGTCQDLPRSCCEGRGGNPSVIGLLCQGNLDEITGDDACPIGTGFTLTSLDPLYARPGEVVTIHGTEFDPTITYSVRVGELQASVASRSADAIEFIVPNNAVTGFVTVSAPSSESPSSYRLPLTIVREIPISFAPELSFSTEGFSFGTLYTPDVAAVNDARIAVGQGEANLAMALSTDNQLRLLALMTDEHDSIQLNPVTTAEALLYLHPSIQSLDSATAETRMPIIRAHVDLEPLAEHVEAHLRAGTSWIEDRATFSLFRDAFDAYVKGVIEMRSLAAAKADLAERASTEAPAIEGLPIVTHDLLTELRGSNFNLQNRDNLIVSTDSKVKEDRAGHPFYEVKMTPRGSGNVHLFNPVDVIVHLYELDPDQFDRRMAEVLDQTDDFESTYRRLSYKPLSTYREERTTLLDEFGRLVNPIGYFKDEASKSITEAVRPSMAPKSLHVPARRPGIYIIRAFSGASFPLQLPLIAAIPDGRIRAEEARALNWRMLALTYAGYFIKNEKMVGEGTVANILDELEKKRLEESVLSEAGVGEGATDRELLERAAIKATADSMLSKATDRLSGGPAALIQSFLSDLVTTDERYKFMTAGEDCTLQRCRLFSTMTVESAFVIVGDPWAPVIDSFTPKRGIPGTLITVTGTRLKGGARTVVEFPSRGGTSPVRAEVHAASPGSLVISVPEGVAEGEQSFTIKHVSEFEFVLSATTSKEKFEVSLQPVITHIDPPMPRRGEAFMIHGTNLAQAGAVTKVNGIVPWSAEATMVWHPGKFEETPEGRARIQLTVTCDFTGIERVSNVFVFDQTRLSIPESPDTDAPIGARIRVTEPTFENDGFSGEISLLEALLLARGESLGRGLTPSERRYISGTPGLTVADVIEIDSLTGTINLTQPAPALASFDTIVGGSTLNAMGRTHALSVVDVDKVKLSGLELTGFTEAPIELRNVTRADIDIGASRAGADWKLTLEGVNYSKVRVSATVAGFELRGVNSDSEFGVGQVGRYGVVIGGSSLNNKISTGTVSSEAIGVLVQGDVMNNIITANPMNCGSHGFQVLGDQVSGLELAGETKSNAGWGVLIDGGAVGTRVRVHAVENAEGGIAIMDRAKHSFVGRPSEMNRATYFNVLGNGGHGVLVRGARTRIGFVRSAGNSGDGIRLEGGGSGHMVSEIIAGFAPDGTKLGNTGSGIHVTEGVHQSVIGTTVPPRNSIYAPESYIGWNEQHGIWLDGGNVRNIEINRVRIGSQKGVHIEILSGTRPRPEHAPSPNGEHGIAVTGGAHDNLIGGVTSYFTVEVVCHNRGAGVYFGGATTTRNLVVGSRIGLLGRFDGHPDLTGTGAQFGNKIGVHLADQASENVIGAVGTDSPWLLWPGFTPNAPEGRTAARLRNVFQSNGTGLLIESGAPLTNGPGADSRMGESNIVINNVFDRSQPNTIGIKVQPSPSGELPFGNRIGGILRGEGNDISGESVGLHIDRMDVSRDRTTRVLGNTFLGDTTVPIGDPLATIPENRRVGILVTQSRGQVIGGLDHREGNDFRQHTVAVYIDKSSGVELLGNRIGEYYEYDGQAERYYGNWPAGLILRDSTDCTVGPGNSFVANGISPYSRYPQPHLAALAISGGGRHEVIGNWIGLDSKTGRTLGNGDHGIFIRDSRENLIGGDGARNWNVIVATEGNGISLEGPGTRGTLLKNNWLGLNPTPTGTQVRRPNTGDGLSICCGASNNLAKSNLILISGGAGVLVSGPSASNALISNTISENVNRGIELQGGNNEIPAPIIESFNGDRAFGSVDRRVPDNSLVQVFSDDEDEGRVLQGQARVVVGRFIVQTGMIRRANLTATVTDLSNNTSEFGGVVLFPPVLEVAKTDSEVVTRTSMTPDEPTVVADWMFASQSGVIALEGLRVKADGSMHDAMDVAAVLAYRDTDGDGEVSEADEFLAGPLKFTEDNGILALAFNDVVIAPREPLRLLIAFKLRPNTAEGATAQVRLEREDDVTGALMTSAATPSAVIADFPVPSDVVAVGRIDRADLTLELGPYPVRNERGQLLTLPVTASNAGPNTADSVKIDFVLPVEVGFVDAILTGGECVYTYAGHRVTCTRPQLAVGERIDGHVRVRASGRGDVRINVLVTTIDFDPDPIDNSVAAPVQLVGNGDVNDDEFVDSDDFTAFAMCMNDGIGMLDTCPQLDFDGDEVIDLKDFARLQQLFHPALIACTVDHDGDGLSDYCSMEPPDSCLDVAHGLGSKCGGFGACCWDEHRDGEAKTCSRLKELVCYERSGTFRGDGSKCDSHCEVP